MTVGRYDRMTVKRRVPLLAMRLVPPIASAQATRTVTMRIDNDAFDFWMSPWNRPDEEYSSGVHISVQEGDAPWWARRYLSFAPSAGPCTVHATQCRTARFEIGQDIYGP